MPIENSTCGDVFGIDFLFKPEDFIVKLPLGLFEKERLKENKIGSRPFFWCMHEQPVFQNIGLFNSESYPQAEKIYGRANHDGVHLNYGYVQANHVYVQISFESSFLRSFAPSVGVISNELANLIQHF